MSTEISIIIPTYKRHSSLERTLKSVIQNMPSSSEIIVVDQSPDSKEKSQSFCKQYPFLKYICLAKPSLPNARNTGIINSTGTIILFLDDDTVVHPDCFKEHITIHTQNSVSAVAGRVKQMDNRISWANISTVATINNKTGETAGNFDLEYEGDVLYAWGGNMSFKRNIFSKSGLFNTRFIGNALFEDVDFCFRIRKFGYSIRYNSKALVYHYPTLKGGCYESKGTQYLIERLHNHILFYLLHINKIPSKFFLIYLKNLIEYISRKKNNRHSILQVFLCILYIFKAYINANISLLIKPKLSEKYIEKSK